MSETRKIQYYVKSMAVGIIVGALLPFLVALYVRDVPVLIACGLSFLYGSYNVYKRRDISINKDIGE